MNTFKSLLIVVFLLFSKFEVFKYFVRFVDEIALG